MKEIEESAKIKIEAMHQPENISDLIGIVFWKEPKLIKDVIDFIQHVKEWEMKGSPYKVTEWQNYCIRKGISQSSYHNILRRLRRVGMIKKIYNKALKVHELKISRDFSDYLFAMEKIWDDFCKS
ncbi:MAG: hypothetical protein QW802_02110 [Candidatus Altiarchaeota archaeon]